MLQKSLIYSPYLSAAFLWLCTDTFLSWELFPTLQTSKDFQLITVFSLKWSDWEMLPFSWCRRTDFQKGHLPWCSVSHPESLADFSVSEIAVCILSKYSDNPSTGNVIITGSYISQTALVLPHSLGTASNFDCTCITLYLSYLWEITYSLPVILLKKAGKPGLLKYNQKHPPNQHYSVYKCNMHRMRFPLHF